LAFSVIRADLPPGGNLLQPDAFGMLCVRWPSRDDFCLGQIPGILTDYQPIVKEACDVQAVASTFEGRDFPESKLLSYLVIANVTAMTTALLPSHIG
jgi:hypothetical protein